MTTATRKTTPTFVSGSTMLTGAAANEAWGNQRVRCDCGRVATAKDSVSGRAGDKPAVWLGCKVCHSALGTPLIYRLPSQM